MAYLWTGPLVTKSTGSTGREGASNSVSQAGGVTGTTGPSDKHVGGGSVYACGAAERSETHPAREHP